MVSRAIGVYCGTRPEGFRGKEYYGTWLDGFDGGKGEDKG